MKSKQHSLDDILPLTCSRTGTCCHGKVVRINPWELAQFSRSLRISSQEFYRRYLDVLGMQIRFDGKEGWKGLQACSLYDSSRGCVAHAGRPLACRLYPLGREVQRGEVRYMHRGQEFPCLEGCAEVRQLPQMTVREYLQGQSIEKTVIAQDMYLEMLQDLADGAMALLLETGMDRENVKRVLRKWEQWRNPLEEVWESLLLHDSNLLGVDSRSEISAHAVSIQLSIQGALQKGQATGDLSYILMCMALRLAQSLGLDPLKLLQNWKNVVLSQK